MRDHPRLFEISAWPWLERLSRREARHVTFADVPAAAWNDIANNRFDWVFLMGVWRRSALGRDLAQTEASLVDEYHRVLPGWTSNDVPGSPYCVEAYEPDPRIGGWEGLEEARRQLHRRGIRLMLDFVPNHTGFDHAWVTAHPHRYILGTDQHVTAAPQDYRTLNRAAGRVHVACGRDPYFPPWRDVAQLNYFNPDTRTAMTETLREISRHCDGVRCDMAMLVLNDIFARTWGHLLHDAWPRPADEFWTATTALVPDLTYLAEVYWNLEGTMLEQGFDFAYDKRLLDALHSDAPAGRSRAVLESPVLDGRRLARFIENHDEPRSAERLGERLTAAAVLISTAPGMRFFYDGQFEGRRVKAPVQLGRWPDEPVDDTVAGLYERVLRVSADRVFREGDWRMLDVSAAGDLTFNDIVAYRWRSAARLAIVVVNLRGSPSQAHVAVAADLPPGAGFDFHDTLTGARYRWTRESLEQGGLYVRLEGGQAHVLFVETGA
jgi:glycosidase